MIVSGYIALKTCTDIRPQYAIKSDEATFGYGSTCECAYESAPLGLLIPEVVFPFWES